MTEWGLPPEYILKHWTEAKLLLMFQKRNERLHAMNEAMKPPEERTRTPKRISAEDLFAQMGSGIRKVH